MTWLQHVRRQMAGSMVVLLTLGAGLGRGETSRSLTDLSGPWQLFVDDHLVAGRTNVTRQYHAFQKHPANPLVVVDKPWERDIVKCAAVLPTEDGSGYRMWYSCWTHANDPDKGHVCYAASKDGVRWEKPNMGMRPWKVTGTMENNIVDGISTIMHTPWEKDPSRRYQGIGGNYYPSASPDGLHWTKLSDKSSVKGGGDVGRFMWDPFTQRFRGYVKVGAEVRGLRRRAIGFSETTDLTDFPPLRLILAPDDVDDRWTISGSVQRAHFYGCNFFAYESMYLGLLWIFRAEELTEGYFHGPMFVELISSRDGVHWLREEGDRPPMLPVGKPPRAWDGGMLCPVPPIRVGRELRLYYSGYDGPHDYLPFKSAIGLATLRKDGFVSLDAGEAPGEVLTRRLEGLTGELHVNCQAGGGSLTVEFLDAGGSVLPGYGRGDCDPIQADSIDQVVTWHGKAALPQVSGPMRLRFILQKASLYSFRAGEGVRVIEEPKSPELQVLYTFEGGAGRAFSDVLPADGLQPLRRLGTSKLDRDASNAAFGSGSLIIGSQFRPLSRLEIGGTRNLGTRFMLAAMVRSADNRYARLLSAYRGNYPADTSELIFDLDPESRHVAGLRLVCKGIPVQSDALSFADGKYHHLGVVYDDGTVDFYLDGKPAGRRYLPGGAPVTLSRDLLLGEDAELGSDEQLRGNVDDVLVLGRALTSEEMGRLSRAGAEKLLAGPDAVSRANP